MRLYDVLISNLKSNLPTRSEYIQKLKNETI